MRFKTFLLGLVLAAACLSVFASADAPGTNVIVSTDLAGELAESVHVRLYDVSDSENPGVLAEEFAKYGLNQGSPEFYKNLWVCLYRDGVAVRSHGELDADGQIEFYDLTPGIYIICGDTLDRGSMKYSFEPVVLQVEPKTSSMMVSMACNRLTITGGQHAMTVQGVFDGDSSDIPAVIPVQLLRDGKLFATFVLLESNDYKYTWPELSDDYFWSIACSPVEGMYIDIYGLEDTYTVGFSEGFTPAQSRMLDAPTDGELDDLIDHDVQAAQSDDSIGAGSVAAVIILFAMVGVFAVLFDKRRKHEN